MPVPGLGPGRFVKIVYDETLKRYRRNGRFVSAAAYRSQQWRMRGGKAGTVRKGALAENFGQWMRAEVGPPGGSMTWKQLYTKYPERLEDYIDEWNEQRRG